MSMITLYHAARSRSSVALWMLEEIGAPYELHLLDLRAGEHKSAGYLVVNPLGKVPALVHDGAIVTETAAICCYLADAFPAAGLSVPAGDAQRGPYLRWLFFGPGCLEPSMLDGMLNRPAPERAQTLGWPSMSAVLEVLKSALADKPYLMGERFTAADVVIGSALRWAAMSRAIPEETVFEAYLRRLEQRPALRAATDKDAAIMAAKTG